MIDTALMDVLNALSIVEVSCSSPKYLRHGREWLMVDSFDPLYFDPNHRHCIIPSQAQSSLD